MTTAADEDQWEYEYDAHERESLYVTMDFSQHLTPGTAIFSAAATPSKDEPLQLLDLHSDSPLVIYGGHFYTCYWSTDLGSSLYLQTPPAEGQPRALLPLRSYDSFDILAKTRARLVAVPAAMKPNAARAYTSATDGAQPPQATEPAVDNTDREGYWTTETPDGDTLTYGPGGSLKIRVPENASAVKTSQARFLEAWSVLRAKRGKNDYAPIRRVQGYKLPDGWEAERREWSQKAREEQQQAADEAARQRALGLPVVPNADMQVRKRRRRTTRPDGQERTSRKRDRGGVTKKIGRPSKIAIDPQFKAGEPSRQAAAPPSGPDNVMDQSAASGAAMDLDAADDLDGADEEAGEQADDDVDQQMDEYDVIDDDDDEEEEEEEVADLADVGMGVAGADEDVRSE